MLFKIDNLMIFQVRIFSMNLDKRDIDALLAMRDANFW